MDAMWFVFAAFAFMMVGRKIGWAVSKGFLYTAPTVVSFVGAVVWGIAVGWCMSGLIRWQHPNVIFKWILGFGLAAYVAIPNFGLLDESTIPEWEQKRHAMITWVPLIAYIITEFATRSMRV